ncbi:MAG: hypothetical protein ACOYB1_16950 [Limnohabitans sp.]
MAKCHRSHPERVAQLLRLVNADLDVAEDMALRKMSMTLQDRSSESDFDRLIRQMGRSDASTDDAV